MNERHFSSFERWPDAVFYAPIVVYWLWLALRYRSTMLLTAADPGIEYGGFVGESKIEAFALLGAKGEHMIAPYISVMAADDSFAEARQALEAASLAYPIVAKPDYGKNGTGVKILHDDAGLAEYLATFPKGQRVILQKYIEEEGEAGIFYIRHPGEPSGRIASITLKYFPRVTGDGVQTLRALILADPRARQIKEMYFRRHPKRLDTVIPAGESVRLISVGNHCKGAIFKNGIRHATSVLAKTIDEVAKEIPEYYFGRFDVRFSDTRALERGEFTIIEYNGAGSEMTHIWDADEKLFNAYRALFGQYREAFEIGNANRARGFKPASLLTIGKVWLDERKLLAASTHEE